MVSAENRKPLIILGLCCLVAVLVLVLGVGLGRRGNKGGSTWQSRLSSLVAPAALRPGDLTLTSGACAVTGAKITVTGDCTLAIPPHGGAFSVKGVTRQSRLAVGGFPVEIAVDVGGRRIAQTVKPGDDPVRLTFGRDGGTLHLRCLFGTCAVVFAGGNS